MIENIIILMLLAYLIKTTGRRCYIGWVVFSYYAIFVLVDVELFGFGGGDLTSYLYSHWYLFQISTSISFALLCTYLCYLGCKLCGIYAGWLILINSPIMLLKLIYPTDANTIDLLYNGIQNINLGVDLIVVVLGTDNILHRTRYFDTAINFCNNRVDRCSFFAANSRNEDNEK